MKKIPLSKLSNSYVVISSSALPYYNFYDRIISPTISSSERMVWMEYQCAQLTKIFKGNKENYQLIHHFLIMDWYNKHIDKQNVDSPLANLEIANEMDTEKVHHWLINEILFFIIRYRMKINLKECHEGLKEILPKEVKQEFFGSDEISVSLFKKIIGVSQGSYYKK